MDPVSILIPTKFNNRWTLELNIKSIRKYTTDCPYKIIIGDAGMDQETKQFILEQNDVEIIACSDELRPKEHLAETCQTKYFIFLHDDVYILRPGWLSRRVKIMEENPTLGILGLTGGNLISGWKWKQFLPIGVLNKRFFPLGMLVRNEMQKDLKLVWGKIKGMDTGAIAYYQFLRQKKWKFKSYQFKYDMKHWGAMTWTVQKKRYDEKTSLNVDNLLKNREEKENLIKRILLTNDF